MNPTREEALFAAALERPARFSMPYAKTRRRYAPYAMPGCVHRTHP